MPGKQVQCTICSKSMRSDHLKRHAVVHNKESDLKIRKRRKVTGFISTEDFNRLAYCCDPIPWTELADDCIYQLRWVNPAGTSVIGNMLASDGASVSVILPKSVVDKLLSTGRINWRSNVYTKEG